MEIIDIKNIKSKKIIFTKPIKHVLENKKWIYKMKSYILDSVENINKIIFISPLIENSIDFNELKFIKFNLEPLIGNMLSFLNIIDYIEELSLNELKLYFSNIEIFKSAISEQSISDDEFATIPSVLNFICNIDKNIQRFDIANRLIDDNTKKLCPSQNYKLVIEFTEIWYDFYNKKGGCNFNIVQIKMIESPYSKLLIDLSTTTIIKDKPSFDSNKTIVAEEHSKQIIQSKLMIKPNIKPNPMQITPEMLLQMKSKLKK